MAMHIKVTYILSISDIRVSDENTTDDCGIFSICFGSCNITP